ncbi:hypothetical protein HPB47_013627 [Ixodes persulcatus]|uniref:Uncharacterized protein n=1 Tax=Ixodes persulcatus TaxID=34615 RepID=A0AC60QY37_IXOPE|nr:hypothetical protein HPB47_013627 [Ixodes persulcatus]
MKIPLERDEQGGKWITPGKPRKSRFPADPNPELHVVIVHLPVLAAGAAAQPLDILPAFLQAAQLPAHTCADVSLHFRQNNRLAALRIHHEAIVNRLLRITSITLQNTSSPVHSYLAAPNNSCRGVMRGIASGATPDEFINDLESYQADILHASPSLQQLCRVRAPYAGLPGQPATLPPVFHHRTSSLHFLVCVASTRSVVLKQGTWSRISCCTFTHPTRRIPQQF